MQTTRSVASFVLAVLPAVALVPGQAPAQERSERTDSIFAEWARPDSPGCALAVIRGGEIDYAKGYGMADLEHDVPITPSTVFYIGSTSKQFVTMCVALLEESGDLDFDDEVRAHIPELPRYEKPVTIRQLIHHTSGVRDYLELWHLAGRDYMDHVPEQAVLDLICRQKELNFAPGSRHLYSNSCYFLLAVLVECVSGVSLREYAQQNIFDPLGMKSSRFHDDHHELIANRAFSYLPDGEGGFANLIMRFDLVGSGGVYATVEDLAKWDQNFYQNQLGAGDPALLETMHTRGQLDDGRVLDYALALSHGSYRGARTVSHGGALAGYRAQFLRFPEHDFSVAILCNLGSMNPTALAERVADIHLENDLAAAPAAVAEAAAGTDAREVVSVDLAVLEPYVGTYQWPDRGITVTLEGDRLMMETNVGETARLWPTSQTHFFVKEESLQVRFEPEDDGTCDTVVVSWQGQEFRGVRVVPPAVDLAELRALAGDYASAELEVTYRLRLDGDALWVSVGYAPKYSLRKKGDGVWQGGMGTLVFERSEDGATTGFRLSTGRVENLSFERKSQ